MTNLKSKCILIILILLFLLAMKEIINYCNHDFSSNNKFINHDVHGIDIEDIVYLSAIL